MATNTTNYGFKKPDESDFYDVADQNKNWDLADEALKNLDTPTFEDYTGSTAVPSATDAIDQIKSKGKLGTLLSNIKAAFKGACLIGHIVNNCVTDNAGLPLSAAQGKVLKDLYTQLYSDLSNFVVARQISADVTIPNGSPYSTSTHDITCDIPSGYKYVGILRAWCIDPSCFVWNAYFRDEGKNAKIDVSNLNGTQKNTTVFIGVLYAKIMISF